MLFNVAGLTVKVSCCAYMYMCSIHILKGEGKIVMKGERKFPVGTWKRIVIWSCSCDSSVVPCDQLKQYLS